MTWVQLSIMVLPTDSQGQHDSFIQSVIDRNLIRYWYENMSKSSNFQVFNVVTRPAQYKLNDKEIDKRQ